MIQWPSVWAAAAALEGAEFFTPRAARCWPPCSAEDSLTLDNSRRVPSAGPHGDEVLRVSVVRLPRITAGIPIAALFVPGVGGSHRRMAIRQDRIPLGSQS